MARTSYIKHISTEDIAQAVDSGLLAASTDFSKVRELDAVLICVPTPLDQHREPDISYVLKSGEAIAPYLRPINGQPKKLVMLESTTYPGTTDTDLKQVLETVLGSKQDKIFTWLIPRNARIQDGPITRSRPFRRS